LSIDYIISATNEKKTEFLIAQCSKSFWFNIQKVIEIDWATWLVILVVFQS